MSSRRSKKRTTKKKTPAVSAKPSQSSLKPHTSESKSQEQNVEEARSFVSKLRIARDESTRGKQETKGGAPAPAPASILMPVKRKGIQLSAKTFDLTNVEYESSGIRDSDEDYKIHKRIDYGTKGTKVDVCTNHVLLAIGDDVPRGENTSLPDVWWRSAFIYTYHIDFLPPPLKGGKNKGVFSSTLSKPKKFELIKALFQEDEALNKNKDLISFNGEDTLYSHIPLEKFTLFDGCWVISGKKNKQNTLSKGPQNLPNSQIRLQYTAKIALSDIYKDTLSRDPEKQETKMASEQKTALMSLLGAKFLQSSDPIFQLQGNKFFIFNKDTHAIPFSIGGYLMSGFTVSLRYAYGSVLLNTINVALPFFKHTKYLPGDPKFKENEKERYNLMDWLIECYHQTNSKRGVRISKPPTAKEVNAFFDGNFDIKKLIQGLQVNKYYINYSINPDGTPKPSKKMPAKSILGFSRETADSLKFNALTSSMTKGKVPRPGETTTIVSTKSYFARRYNIELKYPAVRMVDLGGKNIVPAECLTIVPGQKLKGNFSDEKAVMEFTAIRPAEKFKLISNLALPRINDALNSTGKDASAPQDSSFCLLKVPSRVIDAPIVNYKFSSIEYLDKPFGTICEGTDVLNNETKGNWSLINHKFVTTTEDVWNLRAIFINSSSEAPKASTVNELTGALKKFGADVSTVGVKFDISGKPILINNFNAPTKKMIHASHGGKDGRQFNRGRGGYAARGPATFEITPGETSLVKLLTTIPPKTYVLFVLAHSYDSVIYNRLKEIADLRFGILNSCMLWNNFKKRAPQYNVHAVMKMNLKMHGINHSLSSKNAALFLDKKTGLPFLILGADVTHYPERNQKSIAALVGSFDTTFTKFPGDYLLQSSPGEEIIAGIGKLILNRLKLYQTHCGGNLPPRILFYRDGVSESQFSEVVQIEVKSLKEAIKKACLTLKGAKDYEPPITCIAVVKRNHVRFLPLQKNAMNEKGELAAVQSMGNVMPGTVVDRGITSSAHFDFFLQSQQALKGTGVPCHYWCIYNENQFDSDYLQAASHALCYIFGRSTTSIKVVSPIYYADLLCERAAQFFKSKFPVVNAEFQRTNKNKDAVIPGFKLLPPVNEKIRNLMYYI